MSGYVVRPSTGTQRVAVFRKSVPVCGTEVVETGKLFGNLIF